MNDPLGRRRVLALLSAVVVTPAAGTGAADATRPASRQELADFIARQLDAWRRGDVEAVARMMHPISVERQGGAESMRRLLERVARTVRSGSPERLGEIDRVTLFQSAAADVWLYVVESTHIVDVFPRPVPVQRTTAIAARGAWTAPAVVTASCMSVTQLDRVAPGFRGSASAADLIARGLVQSD